MFRDPSKKQVSCLKRDPRCHVGFLSEEAWRLRLWNLYAKRGRDLPTSYGFACVCFLFGTDPCPFCGGVKGKP